MITLIIIALSLALVNGQYVHEVVTPSGPVHPYSFAFTAGRYPGNIDRTRAEYGDEDGIVRGLYTYVDPRHEVRAVEYIADKNGFHPVLNIPANRDTPAVIAARSRHLKLFSQIASHQPAEYPAETRSVAEARKNHATLYNQIAEEHARIAAQLEATRIEAERQEYYRKQNEIPVA